MGEWRADYRMAYLSSLMVNLTRGVHHDPKKGDPDLTEPSDFLPDWGNDMKDKKTSGTGKSQEEINKNFKQYVLTFARDHNKRVKKRKQ